MGKLASDKSLRDFFAQSGPLADVLAGYQPRQSQIDMALAVTAALTEQSALICEAPTGVGKTFAYLIPALASDQRVLISTATKTLQDQLLGHDIERVCQALHIKSSIVTLKGRNNYFCHYHFDINYHNANDYPSHVIEALTQVGEWSERTRSGDLNQLADLPERSEAWALSTSTQDNCLGQTCPHIGQCFLVKARKKAYVADVVIINHHLLFADTGLFDDTQPSPLLDVDAVILDEAHQIPEIASRFLGQRFSSRDIQLLAEEIQQIARQETRDMQVVFDFCSHAFALIDTLVGEMRNCARRDTRTVLLRVTSIKQTIEDLLTLFETSSIWLESAIARTKSFVECGMRLQLAYKTLNEFYTHQNKDTICWYEQFAQHVVLHLTPVCIDQAMQQLMQEKSRAWIFTSATLAVNGQFSFFKQQMGLPDDTTALTLSSPFNFSEQSLLYTPRGLPDTGEPEYTQACVQAVLPIIERLKGRTFFLFTSHSALQNAADYFRLHSDLPLLVQSEANRGHLLSVFQNKPHCVLFGTNTFWEGVDVRGSALSCVIIDKLPFAHPNDPVHQARMAYYRTSGLHAFDAYQLPKAIIMLKQGAGRLIRDKEDSGVLIICDPRLIMKDYGLAFIKSLPHYPRTREPKRVNDFLEALVF